MLIHDEVAFLGGYYPGTLLCSQVSATLSKIWQLLMKPTNILSLDVLQLLELKTNHPDISNDGHQSDMPFHNAIWRNS